MPPDRAAEGLPDRKAVRPLAATLIVQLGASWLERGGGHDYERVYLQQSHYSHRHKFASLHDFASLHKPSVRLSRNVSHKHHNAST